MPQLLSRDVGQDTALSIAFVCNLNKLTSDASKPISFAGKATSVSAQTVPNTPQLLTRDAVLGHQIPRHLRHCRPHGAGVWGRPGISTIRVPIYGDHVEVSLQNVMSFLVDLFQTQFVVEHTSVIEDKIF